MTEHLIKRAKKGDSDAFCRLMDMQTQSMYKVARSYLNNDEDAADAIQDTILSCWENLRSLKQDKYFKTWMIRILINKCKDILHNKKLVTCTDILPDTPFYEENYETAEWNQTLAFLDEKYRMVLLLYYLEGFTIKDISEILNMKESTVKSRLQRGRAQVAEKFRLKDSPQSSGHPPADRTDFSSRKSSAMNVRNHPHSFHPAEHTVIQTFSQSVNHK